MVDFDEVENFVMPVTSDHGFLSCVYILVPAFQKSTLTNTTTCHSYRHQVFKPLFSSQMRTLLCSMIPPALRWTWLVSLSPPVSLLTFGLAYFSSITNRHAIDDNQASQWPTVSSMMDSVLNLKNSSAAANENVEAGFGDVARLREIFALFSRFFIELLCTRCLTLHVYL